MGRLLGPILITIRPKVIFCTGGWQGPGGLARRKSLHMKHIGKLVFCELPPADHPPAAAIALTVWAWAGCTDGASVGSKRRSAMAATRWTLPASPRFPGSY